MNYLRRSLAALEADNPKSRTFFSALEMQEAMSLWYIRRFALAARIHEWPHQHGCLIGHETDSEGNWCDGKCTCGKDAALSEVLKLT